MSGAGFCQGLRVHGTSVVLTDSKEGRESFAWERRLYTQ